MTIEVGAPTSMNAASGRSTRGAGFQRHKRKRALQADLANALLAAGVPRPIPGDRVRATAEVLSPTGRRRDEGNYRTGLEKALGDALAPHDPDAPHRWLTDDTPRHFTFGTVTFGRTDLVQWTDAGGKARRRRKPAVARIRLVWGEDLVAELQRELDELQAVYSEPVEVETVQVRTRAELGDGLVLEAVSVPVLDTGIGRGLGYRDDRALIDAARDQRDRLDPTIRAAVEQIEQRLERELLNGPEGASS